MQTTVQNLEELAQQSRINYTVVKDSPYYEYFKNMANAEEDLYNVWKKMTLESNRSGQNISFYCFPQGKQLTKEPCSCCCSS